MWNLLILTNVVCLAGGLEPGGGRDEGGGGRDDDDDEFSWTIN